jgi:hypothetical protein
MLAIDQDLTPYWIPPHDCPPLVEFRNGTPEVDARIMRWFANARFAALAYQRKLRPQTRTFASQLADFDRRHAATPEPRRSLIWRLPALSIAINRLCDRRCYQATLWRCYALHLADFAELKSGGFPSLPVAEEWLYALMAATLLRAATDDTP